jgi:ferredoxin
MLVRVNTSKCSGHGRCFAVAPKVYQLTPDGYTDTPNPAVKPGLEEEARKGAKACPERAIEIVEE